MATAKSLRIREYDDADNLVATYIQSEGASTEESSRIDVIVGGMQLHMADVDVYRLTDGRTIYGGGVAIGGFHLDRLPMAQDCRCVSPCWIPAECHR